MVESKDADLVTMDFWNKDKVSSSRMLNPSMNHELRPEHYKFKGAG